MKELKYRVNEAIKSREVQVIGPDGKSLGIMRTWEAIQLAKSMGLDLVEVSPNSNPPVAKIMNYGKFMYEQKKKLKEMKKHQKSVEVKEIQITPTIDKHDLGVKMRKAREFLSDGNKVKFKLIFKGRQIVHPEIAKNVLENIINELSDISDIEQAPKDEGRFIIMILRPKSKK
ncbi:MAG: translation initiation factor IF-3 [candidate division WOR-3 bacterium]|nr:translation initiation factor IF-3 [candidate division WOR-3 bacterium]MCX7947515.1 translation initiation factor IF-3 [candidate division WOR-3 bacterium]MDW8150401.1 translation initiation factor IF-3 [candidate division WOR-3 bacterium]